VLGARERHGSAMLHPLNSRVGAHRGTLADAVVPGLAQLACLDGCGAIRRGRRRGRWRQRPALQLDDAPLTPDPDGTGSPPSVGLK
jgi:hypothetical protein